MSIVPNLDRHGQHLADHHPVADDPAAETSADSSDLASVQMRPDVSPEDGLLPASTSRSEADDGGAVTPRIEAEPPIERINVGAGGKLVVPREDIDVEFDDGTELDLLALAQKKIRKPKRREWCALNKQSEMTVKLLQHKPNPDGIETEYYYIAPSLRKGVNDELTDCRVFVCFSFLTHSHFLWIVHVNPNSWYESLQPLLAQPEEFFITKVVRIKSLRHESRYEVRFNPLPASVEWPVKTTEELLGEAVGAERIITDAQHPLYSDLVAGCVLR